MTSTPTSNDAYLNMGSFLFKSNPDVTNTGSNYFSNPGLPNFALPSDPATDPDTLPPAYKRRFGFYFICYNIFVLSIFLLLVISFVPGEISAVLRIEGLTGKKAGALETVISSPGISFSAFKNRLIPGLLVIIVFQAALLFVPKLTTGKDYFWPILLINFGTLCLISFSLPALFNENLDRILASVETMNTGDSKAFSEISNFFGIVKGFVKMLYIFGAMGAGLGSLISTYILTMDDDYKGLFMSLKCFKPYELNNDLLNYDTGPSSMIMHSQPLKV